MASTNKTTNYQLSQFIGTDKPAWLGDYNQDMTKIDTGIKNAADTATAASGSATSANTAIGTLTNLSTEAKTNVVAAVNEVDLNADTAQNTANSANSLATTANNKADTLSAQFNLNQIKLDSQLSFTTSAGSFNWHNITVVTNSDNSLAKIYGEFGLNDIAGTGDLTVTISGTGIAVSSPIVINSHGISTSTIYQLNQSAGYAVSPVAITIGNDTITITIARSSSINQREIILGNALIFLKDFGDIITPTPQP